MTPIAARFEQAVASRTLSAFGKRTTLRRLHVKPWHRLWVVFERGAPDPLVVRPTEEDALIEARWLHKQPRWELYRYGADGRLVGTESPAPLEGNHPTASDVEMVLPPIVGEA